MRYKLGQTASYSQRLTQEDFNRFAALSGDDNPIHIDPEYSARTRFGKPVAHGMLLYSLICRLLGSDLPGPGSLQLSQELIFPAPTYVDEEISVSLQVLRITSVPPWQVHHPAPQVINSPGRYLQLNVEVTKADGSPGCQGVTWVLAPGSSSARSAFFPKNRAAPYPEKTRLPNAWKKFTIGQTARTTRVYSGEDLAEYADLTGDENPVYTDSSYAKSIGFENLLVPGGLLGGLFSDLLGTKLPGPGTNWLKQKLYFLAPVFPGEKIAAKVEMTRLRPQKELVNLGTVCSNSSGEVVCTGEALVLVSDLER